jgi:hypothetical protein
MTRVYAPLDLQASLKVYNTTYDDYPDERVLLLLWRADASWVMLLRMLLESENRSMRRR